MEQKRNKQNDTKQEINKTILAMVPEAWTLQHKQFFISIHKALGIGLSGGNGIFGCHCHMAFLGYKGAFFTWESPSEIIPSAS